MCKTWSPKNLYFTAGPEHLNWEEVTKIPVLCSHHALSSTQHPDSTRQGSTDLQTQHLTQATASQWVGAWHSITAGQLIPAHTRQSSWIQGFCQQQTWSMPARLTLTGQLFLRRILDKGCRVVPIRRNTDCRVVKFAVGCGDRTGCQGQEGHETDLHSAFLCVQHIQLREKQLQEPAHVPALLFQSCTQKSIGQTEAQKKQLQIFEQPCQGQKQQRLLQVPEEGWTHRSCTYTHTLAQLMPQFRINLNVWSSLSSGWYSRWKHNMHNPVHTSGINAASLTRVPPLGTSTQVNPILTVTGFPVESHLSTG